jgi:hypothetical protein
LPGCDGDLGCLVAPELIRDGHHVVGVDTGFDRRGWVYGPSAAQLHVFNAPSPAATSSLETGSHIADRLLESHGNLLDPATKGSPS